MKSLLLQELTSPQIRKAIDEGYKTVIVPVGAIEQHGRHLPVGTDAMDGDLIGVGIAHLLGNTLVAPTIRPGCSDHHMSFAGTISVSSELLKALVGAYCRSLCHHGFQNIVLVASHGGNIQTLNEVAPELDAELACKVVHANILRDPRVRAAREAVLARYGITPEEGGRHSGFTETSLMLASPFGPLVEMDAAQRGFVGDADAKMKEVTHEGRWNLKDVSPIGVMGDPTRSTAEAGRELEAAEYPVYAQVVKDSLGWK